MSTKQELTVLRTYGPDTVKLGEFDTRLTELYMANDPGKSKWQAAEAELETYIVANQQAKALIAQLALDRHMELRSIAASLISHLWMAWKFRRFGADGEPYESYVQKITDYNERLSWTLPVLELLLEDHAILPLEIALYTLQDLEDEPEANVVRLREAALSQRRHPAARVRLALVRTLCDVYPRDDDAHHILEPDSLQFYIDATYDKDEKVRDWALFELHNDIANEGTAVAKAVLDAIDRENPDTDAYMEAVITAARLRIQPERIDQIICNNLSDPDCGSGWVDAVVASQSDKCLLAMIDWYSRLRLKDGHDRWLDAIENALIDWNEL